MENNDNINVQTEKKRVRKVGRLTLGITLILVGLSVIIQTFLPIEIFRYVLMLWPLVFISIGIEVIYFSKKEEIKYDGVGIFLVFVVLFFGTIFGAINYGVNKILYNDNMKNYIAEELNDSVVNYTFSPKIKINNYSVPRDVLYQTLMFISFYFAILAFSAFLIAIVEKDTVVAITGAVSAVGNIGPGFGAIGPLESFEPLHWITKAIFIICFCNIKA